MSGCFRNYQFSSKHQDDLTSPEWEFSTFFFTSSYLIFFFFSAGMLSWVCLSEAIQINPPHWFRAGTVAVCCHVVLLTSLCWRGKSEILALNNPLDLFMRTKTLQPPKQPDFEEKAVLFFVFLIDEAFIFCKYPNSLRYWSSPTKNRHELLFWWSCRSLFTRFKMFLVDTRFVRLKKKKKKKLKFQIP